MQNIKYNNEPLKISCDGGASTGKSTGAKMVSKKYKLKFLSSGLLYRYASFLVLKFKPKNKVHLIKQKFKNFNLNNLNRINLHTQEISENSAKIAKIKSIRDVLKKIKFNFSKKNIRCCIEGEYFNKIMPNSDVNLF